MYWILRIASIFLISVSATTLASQSNSANGEQSHSMSHAPKAMLAVGATLDENGRLWIARVENQRLLVSWSDDDGKSFSTPVIVTPEPETISADGESRPKIAVARDGTVLLTWVQSLPQKYAGNVRFARSTDSGKSFSAPITLNDDGRITSHRFDSMAIDGNGRVVIAWLDARDRDAAREKAKISLAHRYIQPNQTITAKVSARITDFTNTHASVAKLRSPGRRTDRSPSGGIFSVPTRAISPSLTWIRVE